MTPVAGQQTAAQRFPAYHRMLQRQQKQRAQAASRPSAQNINDMRKQQSQLDGMKGGQPPMSPMQAGMQTPLSEFDKMKYAMQSDNAGYNVPANAGLQALMARKQELSLGSAGSSNAMDAAQRQQLDPSMGGMDRPQVQQPFGGRPAPLPTQGGMLPRQNTLGVAPSIGQAIPISGQAIPTSQMGQAPQVGQAQQIGQAQPLGSSLAGAQSPFAQLGAQAMQNSGGYPAAPSMAGPAPWGQTGAAPAAQGVGGWGGASLFGGGATGSTTQGQPPNGFR
jgi:hypothetical protein